MIYFIQESRGYAIKIGYTDGSPHDRLTQLQVANPGLLVLLASHPGTEQDEQALHSEFRQWHIRGEWFQPAWPLLRHIMFVHHVRGQDYARLELAEVLGDHHREWPEWLQPIACGLYPNPDADNPKRFMDGMIHPDDREPVEEIDSLYEVTADDEV